MNETYFHFGYSVTLGVALAVMFLLFWGLVGHLLCLAAERLFKKLKARGRMRHVNQDGIDLIKGFEGYSSTVYTCPAGVLTIGYGHALKAGECFDAGVTEAEAEDLLAQDVETAERAVLSLIHIHLNNNRFNALVSFTYNLGSGALEGSTLRKKVNLKEHAEVPDEFKRWVYAGGVASQGLVNRRNTEADVYSA